MPARRRLRGWPTLVVALGIVGVLAWLTLRTPLPDREAFQSKVASVDPPRARRAAHG